MKQQILQEQLDAIQHICRMVCDEWADGHPQKVLAHRILMTYPVAEDSPSGGMVDTKHSKCFDASRPGSSPGKGTNSEEHPDDLFRWPCGTEATREDIERGYFDFMSDDFVLVDAVNNPGPVVRGGTPCGGCCATSEIERYIGCTNKYHEVSGD